ncbi:MAG: DUF2007 domain-containing protein [Gemmataceae bacterium]|nr:DUF2007 domain-containing protein [Gemmataceae bacterium]
MDVNLTTVATFNTPHEAELAKNLLEQEGITAYLADAEAVGMNWMMGVGLGGVKVQVAEADAPRAGAILRVRRRRRATQDDYGVKDRVRSSERLRPRVDPAEEDEEHDEPEPEANADATRAWRAAVIGLLVLPPLLHFYSAFLLFKLLGGRETLSPGAKRKAIAAAILDALVFAGVVLLLRHLTAPPLVPAF